MRALSWLSGPLVWACVAGLFGCTADPPTLIEASLFQNADDLRGPYQASALVRGGAAPVRVELRVSATGAELDAACAVAFPSPPLRNVDAGPAEPASESGCVAIPLSGGPRRFEARWAGPPFRRGTRLTYAFRAVDDEGRAAWWPPGAPASPAAWIAGPSRAPALEAIAPTEGPSSGGTPVLLRGANFEPGLRVWFGDVPVAAQVESPHLAEVLSPALAPGAVDVAVEGSGGRARLAGGWRATPPPHIAALHPVEGPTTRPTLVVVTGTGFSPGALAQVGDDAEVPTTVVGAERLTLTIPAGPPGPVSVSVLGADGQRSGPIEFRRWAAPTLHAVEPARGPDLGGSRLLLQGRDLRAPGAVWFGARPGLEVRVAPDGRSAEVRTPRLASGVVDVRWYNPDGQVATLEGAYRFVGPPQVLDADPPVLSRCGGGVTRLIGENFEPDMQVWFNGVEGEVLEVDETGTEALVRAPPGDEGPIRLRIRTPDGRGNASDRVVVYGVQPAIRRVTPDRVPIWGGVGVVIEGADFDADVAVFFGDVPAEQVRVELTPDGCEALVLAVEPPNAPGTADVRVSNAGGGEAIAPAGVTYVAPRLVPDHGLTPGFANVRLEGVDLRPSLRVRFGDQRAELARVSDELWRVVTPAGPRGPSVVDVRNVDGRGAELEGAFTYHIFEDATAETGLEPIGDCNDVSVVDVDGDRDLDLVTANGAIGGVGQVDQPVGVHRNDGAGHFETEGLRPAGNGMNANLGDLDADGDPDLLVANLSSASNTYFQNDAGRFTVVPAFVGRGPSYDADFLDADNDGDLDVFLVQTGDPENNPVTGPEQLWLNDGRGRLADASGSVPFDERDVHDHDFAHGDLDGDGLPEVLIAVDNISAQFDGASNRLLHNTGGAFEQIDGPFNDYPGDWLHTELVDLDADGDLDVLMPQDFIEGFSRPGTPALAVFINDGGLRFHAEHERIVDLPRLPAFEVTAADLDGDGDVDLAVSVFGLLFADGGIEPFQSVLLLNDGAGRFHRGIDAFASPAVIATTDFGPADLDGDGDADLFECAARGESRVWLQRP